jgi:hypothetical protein
MLRPRSRLPTFGVERGERRLENENRLSDIRVLDLSSERGWEEDRRLAGEPWRRNGEKKRGVSGVRGGELGTTPPPPSPQLLIPLTESTSPTCTMMSVLSLMLVIVDVDELMVVFNGHTSSYDS